MSPRVGIDYLPACTHWPGVGRYARELVRALVALEDGPELGLFEFGAERRTIRGAPLGLAGHEARWRRRSVRLPRRALVALHRLTGRGADDLLGGVDLFHRILPGFPPVRSAVRTLAVGEFPEEGTPADAAFARALDADHLLVASRWAADELERRYGRDPATVHEVSLGCDHWRRDLPGPVEPDPEPTLLVLGAVRAARRQVEILRAFERLAAAGEAARLVVVGAESPADGAFRSALTASPARERVEWRETPVEAELPGLVARAAVLVHLSRGEGTAVTPLEACSFGAAVVTNAGGPFEEALGRLATYVTPDGGADAVTDAVRGALGTAFDPGARAERERLAAGFTWRESARRTAAVWRLVAAGR